MITEILMPRLSETGERSTVVEWLVKVGAQVSKGDPLVRVESDKATLDLDVPRAGTLLRVFFTENETTPAGAVLGLVGDPTDDLPTVDPFHHLQQDTSGRAPYSGVEPDPRGHRGTSGSASSPDGRRRARGVQSCPSPDGPDISAAQILPLSTIRRLTGQRLLQSSRTAPHAFVEVEADVTEMTAWRETLPKPAPSYTAIFVQAASVALKVFPHLNASFAEDGIHIWPEINVGIAVARGDDLIVPVLRRTDEKSLAEIGEFLRGYGPSHGGGLRPQDASLGTFTVSNLGMSGADSVLSILSPGQAGILSLGRIRKKPAVHEGEIVIRSLVRMTIGFDHRVLDGAMAARFLAHLEGMFAQSQTWAN
jgi:pyruvate dehydrogenase E2 component (dihydrolipoamide acetyltransferase)